MDKRGNTLIKTDDGYKEIKDIEVGDLVYSEDPLTGEKGLKRVTNVFVNETSVIVRIYAGDEEIETTPTHPFWVIEKGWVAAGDIEAGDKVYLYSGEGREVKEVRFEYLDTPIKVYNFEVEDWHTYFVSEQDVFVHNECSELPKQKVVKEGGVTIEHYYPNDHGNPVHLHVKGGGSNTKIGPQGKSLKGQPELSSKQKKVVEDNISEIKAIIKKIQKWIRKQ
mgnify:CR=1 FL=1